jgi:hypothetical protein
MLTRLKSAAADEVFKVDHAQTAGSDLIVMAARHLARVRGKRRGKPYYEERRVRY